MAHKNAVEHGERYWAFISYSHADAAFGRWLHRQLEHYRLPKRLVGRKTRQGVLPRRLAPIFRDRDELPAAHDLSSEVRAALQVSQSLVVVCSPSAVSSIWVSREVDEFRALHPDRPVLAALIDGDFPGALPDALRRTLPTGDLTEPLAADFRDIGDGKRLGLLKLVAGMAGVRMGELVQRDAQYRMRRVTAVTAGAVLAMLAMGGMTVWAFNARTEADRQRTEAEGLVEFMLTDLRNSLKGVGRLDAMTAVNERALRYYSGRNLSELPPESLERRARILHAMGEDDEARGEHEAATRKFAEAHRTTRALLAASPNNPERIYEHAQSEFWVGYIDFQKSRYSDSRKAFEHYLTLARKLVSIDPSNPIYLREVGYAEGNLCSVALVPPKRPSDALSACRSALEHMERAARRSKNPGDFALDLASRHAWLADAYRANYDQAQARAHRVEQEGILSRLMQRDPKNMLLKSKWIAAQRILAWMDAEAGKKDEAFRRLRKLVAISTKMIAFDPSNKLWVEQRSLLESDMAELRQRRDKARRRPQ